MSLQSWGELIIANSVDGPTLTAAAAASCIPTPNRGTLNKIFFQVGKKIRIMLAGRISCVVTTPGTARFDVRLGPSGTIIVFDTGALNLNVVVKTNVPWWLDIWLSCRAIGAGTATTLFGFGQFISEAVVGAPANTAGGNGVLMCPVGAPAVGTGFDNTAANVLDVFFTQTVATGSLTVHEFNVFSLN